MTPDAFAALPLDEQLAHLSENFDHAPAGELLHLAASIRDWAPLAWLCGELLATGWLESNEHRVVFSKFLLDQPETAVHRVVRAMLERASEVPARGQDLCEALLEMLRVVPVERISSMCLIDRSLKHNFSQARDAHVASIVERTREALAVGALDVLTSDMLAQLSGRAVPELREVALQHSEACLRGFDEARAAMAKAVIETLGNAPKAISQSNAEELLSTRVYTDPGHFLIELLQNAEDAGAKHWRVIFDVDRIIVWHDGNPFDARDLVGVTSIGQTTKRKDQIGFFGVGFKSVYEVTARPRIYSDAFQFEIADVSVPKLLRDRPVDLPENGTVLILPLKDPNDPARTPARLHAMARAIDPCVLFTLRGVDLLTIELTERVEGGPQRWEAIEELPDERGISIIEQRPMNLRRRYVIQDDIYTYTRGKRAAGRADSTLIMVGLSLDEDGVPTPAPPESATVYSYLPTEEHSGLRFFVQGHFDVPVDRERVNPESDWNQWIVSNVPTQIHRALERVIRGEQQPGLGRGILSVLPLDREIKSEVFEPLPGKLTEELARSAILPARDGTLRMASQLRVASPEVCALFEPGASFPLSALSKFGNINNDTPFWLLDETLEPREREVAIQLGARKLDFDGLVGIISHALSPEGDDSRPLAAARAGDIELIARIHDILLDGFEELDRTKNSLQAISLKKKMREIALFPDSRGKLFDAATILVPEHGLRPIYKGVRKLLHPDLASDSATQHDPEQTEEAAEKIAITSRTTALLTRLGVTRLTGDQLLRDLEHVIGNATMLEDASSVGFPGSNEKLETIQEWLSGANWALQMRAAKLPLFHARDGKLRRLAGDPSDRVGALLVPEEHEQLATFYGARRALVSFGVSNAQDALLARINPPALGFEVLLADLRHAGFIERDRESLLALQRLLEAERRQIADTTRDALASLDIWPDTDGTPRRLKGASADERAFLPSPLRVRAFFSDANFLDEQVCAMAHVREMGVEVLGPAAVLAGFAPDASAPLRITPSVELINSLHELLLEDDVKLGTRSRALLETLPLFLDDRGEIRRLVELHDASADLRALYHEPTQRTSRHFIAPESTSRRVVATFGLDAVLKEANAKSLVQDLWAEKDAILASKSPDDLPLLGPNRGAALDYLDASGAQLGSEDLVRLFETPLFLGDDGKLGALGDWSAEQGLDGEKLYQFDAHVAPVMVAAGYRRLSGTTREKIKKLLATSRHKVMGLDGLLGNLVNLEEIAPNAPRKNPLQQPAALEAILVWLKEHGKKLATLRGTALSHLMVWETRAGGVTCTLNLIKPGVLDELITEDAIERPSVDQVSTKHPDALFAIAKWIEVRSASEFLLDLLEHNAQAGKPLRQQRGLLASGTSLAAALTLASDAITQANTLPQVNARGRLVQKRLAIASEQTLQLLDKLAMSEELMDLEFMRALGENLANKLGKPLEMKRVILALREGEATAERLEQHPILSDKARRGHLYTWLAHHEREIFSDPECRELLAVSKLFPTERGSLLPTRNLVLDPNLPDLGVDWRPSSEIPAEVVHMLSRHLGLDDAIGLEELCNEHLIPAYQEATRNEDKEAAHRIFSYLSGRTERVGKQAMYRVLSNHALAVESMSGAFVHAKKLFAVPHTMQEATRQIWGTTQPIPNPARYTPDDYPLLSACGVREAPELHDIADVLAERGISEQTSLGLSTLLARLNDREVEGITTFDVLRETPWVLDGTRCFRRPGEVFIDSLNARALVGDFKEEYAHTAITDRLGEDLARRLGFKTTRDVTLEHIKRHIADRELRGAAVPPPVYRWLELCLTENKLTSEVLTTEFSTLAWVYTDDGHHFHHLDVLGGRHMEMFGERRGYWSQGLSDYPMLCRTFGIERDPNPAFVHRFLGEIAARVASDGDQQVLSDGAIPVMLLANYAYLGKTTTPHRPHQTLILCSKRSPEIADDEKVWRLLPPDHELLLRSDTPDLEDLFARTSTFYVARTGARNQQEDVDRYYQRVGLRLLREAHHIETNANAGEDRTDEFLPKIRPLRWLLRALSEVAPRIQLKLGSNRGKWHIEDRLAGLATTSPIRAIASLEVTYVLDRIGRSSADSDAAWDAGEKTLLVDIEALEAPRDHATGLALGLMPAIYEGPDQDAVIEVVTLLLTLGDFEKMAMHLDRRHYPAIAAARKPSDELAERLGQVLDYNLHKRLMKRFPALRGKDFERWRDREALASLLPEDGTDRGSWASVVAPGLLALIGMEEAATDDVTLTQAITTILAAKRLDDIPTELFEDPDDRASTSDTDWLEESVKHAPMPEAPPVESQPEQQPESHPESQPRRPEDSKAPPATIDQDRAPTSGGSHAWGHEDLAVEARLIQELLEELGTPPTTDGDDIENTSPRVATYVDKQQNPEAAAAFERVVDETLPAIRSMPAPQLTPKDHTTWGRFKRWLGLNAGTAPEVEAPSWTQQGSNPLEPETTIAPQLWVNQEHIQRISNGPLDIALRFEPRKLPSPHLYALKVLGATFDEASQHWLPAGAPPVDWYGQSRPLGREVLFHGTIVPGINQLPLPLYAKPSGAPRIIEGEGVMRAQHRPDGSLWLHLEAEGPVRVSYTLDLLEPPILTGDVETLEPPDALLRPTVELRDLPPATRRFIESRRNSAMSSWELALSAQAFVQTNYIYDDGFMEIPRVARAKTRLRAGEGNHHLEILHASRDDETQGRGICYELNTLLTEVLRHLGLPSMVSSCWVLNEGVVASPDHLVSLVVLPSASGPALMPLDAAVGVQGPIRPMAPSSVASSADVKSTLPPIASSAGPWNTDTLMNMPSQAHVEREIATLRQRESSALATQFAHTRRALVHLLAVSGEAIPDALAGLLGEHASASARSLAQLHAEGARRLGGSPETFAALVAVIRGDYAEVLVLPPAVRELVKRDLVRVESRSRYHVSIE